MTTLKMFGVELSTDEPELVPLFQDALMKRYSKKNEQRTNDVNVHISDLISCIRQAVAKRMWPVPPTHRDVGYFSRGSSVHEAIQSLIEHDPESYQKEYVVDWNVSNLTPDWAHSEDYQIPVVGHIDLLNVKTNRPIEIKTTNSLWNNEPRESNVQQLKYYMALRNADTGYLLYQILTQPDNPFVEFKVKQDPTHHHDELKKLALKAISFNVAHKTGRLDLAPHVMDDKNYVNWLCPKCPYLEQCAKINGKDPSFAKELVVKYEEKQRRKNRGKVAGTTGGASA